MADDRTFADFMPGADAEEDFTATAGAPLQPGVPPVAGEGPVIEALRGVEDPEIPVNLYDLGLIYDINIGQEGAVDINMSLTAPGCPVAGEMPGQVAQAVAAVPGTGMVTVRLVWDPPWSPARMSEDARLALGLL